MNKERKLPICETCGNLHKSIFCHLKHDNLIEMSAHKVTNLYKKGQIICERDVPNLGIFCVYEGKAEVTFYESNGEEKKKVISQNGIIGTTSWSKDKYTDFRAVALEDTICCFFDRTYVTKLFSSDGNILSIAK